jgi:phospholipase C
MMENRAFDHALGWLYDGEQPKHSYPQSKIPENQKGLALFEGLQGKNLDELANEYEFKDKKGNTISSSNSKYGKIPPIKGAIAPNVPQVDPHEDFVHVMASMYYKHGDGEEFFEKMVKKSEREALVKDGHRYKRPSMKGWVQDYADALMEFKKMEDFSVWGKDWLSEIMQTYTPEQLPVLNGLARHYAVSDLWFCSVPSQTQTNRAWAAAGTSAGAMKNSFYDPALPFAHQAMNTGISVIGTILGNVAGNKVPMQALETVASVVANSEFDNYMRTNKAIEGGSQLDAIPGRPTLFDILSLHGVSWKYYWSAAALPPGEIVRMASNFQILFPQFANDPSNFPLDKSSTPHPNFPRIAEFYRDVAAGNLPAVTWLEPILGGGHTWDGGMSAIGNDYHPCGDTTTAEFFVKSIYDAISQSELWEKTLLIITFDENGGNYDHLPPTDFGRPWRAGRMTAPIAEELSAQPIWDPLNLGRDLDPKKDACDLPIHQPSGSPLVNEQKKPVTTRLELDLDRAPLELAGSLPDCDKKTLTQYGFEFDMYGIRIPTILISPHVKQGTVFRSNREVPFDHTSIIATILKWLGIKYQTPLSTQAVTTGTQRTSPLKVEQASRAAWLGARVANAPTFEFVLDGPMRNAADEQVGITRYGIRKTPRGTPLNYGDPFYLKWVGSKWGPPDDASWLGPPESPSHLYPKRIYNHQGKRPATDILQLALSAPDRKKGTPVHNGHFVELLCPRWREGNSFHRLWAPEPKDASLMAVKESRVVFASLGNVRLSTDSEAGTFWQIWLLADRDETTVIYPNDEIIIFSYQTVPPMESRKSPPAHAGNDLKSWMLPYLLAGAAHHPYYRLAVGEDNFLTIRVGAWDIWKIEK